jgi:hypothetical protein
MLPIILGIGAAVASTLTAGEAVLIGATVGSVTALGAKALKKKKSQQEHESNDDTE